MFDPTAQFELQVLPNGRSAADEYLHQGSIWIEGRESSKYVLKFSNKSSGRVNVVLSVDGLDVIKGQPAGPNSQGYVVNAYSTLEVPGWVLDNKTAAEFYFAKAGKSYVSASGNNTANTGVIGAMVFKEKMYYQYNTVTPIPIGWYPGAPSVPNPQPWGVWTHLNYDNQTKSTGMATSAETLRGIGQNAIAPGAASVYHSQQVTASASSTVEQSVGTGFGDATEFTTVTTQFTRQNPTNPDAILAIYYNSLQNLQKMGIQVRTARTNYATSSSANPFPTYSPGCTPPEGWTP